MTLATPATAPPTTSGASIAPPSRVLQLLELRAGWELAAGLAALPWLRMAPRGDGHPVLVLPGLVASDGSTRLLREFLTRRGYAVHGWGLGRNYGPRPGVEAAMFDKLERLHAESGGRAVSLIGQSLGGAYARLLAAKRPELVRSVITLGSPVAGHPRASNAWRVYEFTSGKSAVDPKRWQQVTREPKVPTTSIYSRSDGIVAWRSSLEPARAHTESIEVVSSHVGMAVHPLVLYLVAERLAQAEGRWQPFQRRGWRAAVFPRAAGA